MNPSLYNKEPPLPTLETRQNVQRPRKATNSLVVEPYEQKNVDHVFKHPKQPPQYIGYVPKATTTALLGPNLPVSTLYSVSVSSNGAVNGYYTDSPVTMSGFNGNVSPFNVPISASLGQYGISTTVAEMRQL